jgi:hypothetical protein
MLKVDDSPNLAEMLAIISLNAQWDKWLTRGCVIEGGKSAFSVPSNRLPGNFRHHITNLLIAGGSMHKGYSLN